MWALYNSPPFSFLFYFIFASIVYEAFDPVSYRQTYGDKMLIYS